MIEKEKTWKCKGKGLKRTWYYFGNSGKYQITRQMLDGCYIYLSKIEHNKPCCIRLPISKSLGNAKIMVENNERNS